jgi:membrane-bound lytic murein transglycosylase D
VLAGVPAAPFAAPPDPFPAGPRLAPRVEFWKVIYSRITTDQVILHDAEDLSIVYQTVGLEGRQEWSDIEDFVQPIRERYAEILETLAGGTPPLPGSEMEKVRAAFGAAATPERLQRAAQNVRFQRGQADSFLEGVVRRGAYEVHLRRIFREEGLPYDLTYLPHVESSFRPHAYSRSGAAGIWQFTRSTGRHYLRVSSLVDERWDPIESSRAAARLLRRNYQKLRNWPLAITAYNHGREGMRRAVSRLGTNRLEEIIDRYDGRSFGFASKNFYAEFLAAREVAANAERYFGAVPRWPSLRYQEIRLDREAHAADVMEALDLSICDLAHYNPALRPPLVSGERPLPAGYRLKIPAGLAPPGVSLAALLEARQRPSLKRAPGPAKRRPVLERPPELRPPSPAGTSPAAAPPELTPAAPAPEPPLSAAPSQCAWGTLGEALPGILPIHPDWQPWMREGREAAAPSPLWWESLRIEGEEMRVEPEESLALIASWLKLPVSRLRALNALPPGQPVRLGQRVRLDFSRVGAQEFEAARLAYQRRLADRFLSRHRVIATRVHEVRTGETLWSIARGYGRIPLWVLRWYNSGPQWPEPAPGSRVIVPVVERIAGG